MLDTLCIVFLRSWAGALSRGPAMLAPPLGSTLMLAPVLALSLRVWLASLAVRSLTCRSSSMTLFLSSSFSLFAWSSSCLN